MFGDGALSFQEFMVGERLPLAAIHEAVLRFLRGREDAVLFGAQAVNAYVAEPRMTQDIDLLSPRAAELAKELRDHLASRLHIAVRVREIGEGRGYRLFQVQKPRNRHVVDVRSTKTLPACQRIAGVLVMMPADLIASKVIAYARRRGRPKSGTDWRDLALLLLTFPDLKRDPGPVSDLLREVGGEDVLLVWKELVATEVLAEEEEEEEF